MIFEIMTMMSRRWGKMICMMLDGLDMMQMSGQKNGEGDFDERERQYECTTRCIVGSKNEK